MAPGLQRGDAGRGRALPGLTSGAGGGPVGAVCLDCCAGAGGGPAAAQPRLARGLCRAHARRPGVTAVCGPRPAVSRACVAQRSPGRGWRRGASCAGHGGGSAQRVVCSCISDRRPARYCNLDALHALHWARCCECVQASAAAWLCFQSIPSCTCTPHASAHAGSNAMFARARALRRAPPSVSTYAGLACLIVFGPILTSASAWA